MEDLPDDLPALDGRSTVWSTANAPHDIAQWPQPDKFFVRGSHLLKVWSINPNDIPYQLVPSGSTEAGYYPVNNTGEQESRNLIMKTHNLCPQFTAESTFPHKHFVAKSDEKYLDEEQLKIAYNKHTNLKSSDPNFMEKKASIQAEIEMLTQLVKEHRNPQVQMKTRGKKVSNIKISNEHKTNKRKSSKNTDIDGKGSPGEPSFPKLSDSRVLDWLIGDFIAMFNSATDLEVMLQPFSKKHVDSRLDIIKAPMFPKKNKKFTHGGNVCLYCAKCWNNKIEAPVCFLSINLKDTDDQEATRPLPKKSNNFENMMKKPSKKKNPIYVEQYIAKSGNKMQKEIGPKNYQKKYPTDPHQTMHPKQNPGYGPAIVDPPDYYSASIQGNGPSNMFADEIGPPKSHWTNELMQRSDKYSHISIKVSHLYYHSCSCTKATEPEHLSNLRNGEFVGLHHNFDFVVGPTMDLAYQRIEQVPPHSVILREDTSAEDAEIITETYHGIQIGPLINHADLDNIPDQVKQNDIAHGEFMQKHLNISIGTAVEDYWTDRCYTPGPFHDTELPIGRFHWFVSNARRHYITVCKYGAPSDMCPYLFNWDLYKMQCIDINQANRDFGGYWIRDKKRHIYMNAVSIICGGQELQTNNKQVRHQVKHCDNTYDDEEDDEEETHNTNIQDDIEDEYEDDSDDDQDDALNDASETKEWNPQWFPPSSCMAPFTSRSLMKYPDSGPPLPHDYHRGNMVQFGGKVWHGGKTTRAKERRWNLGWHYHMDSKHKKRKDRRLDTRSTIELPNIPTVDMLKNEPHMKNIHDFITRLTAALQDSCMYLMSDQYMQQLGSTFYNQKDNKSKYQDAANVAYALYLVSRLGKMIDTRLLLPGKYKFPINTEDGYKYPIDEPQDCTPTKSPTLNQLFRKKKGKKNKEETKEQFESRLKAWKEDPHAWRAAPPNSIQVLYKKFTEEGSLNRDPIIENQNIWRNVFDRFTSGQVYGNLILANHPKQALPPILAPDSLTLPYQPMHTNNSQHDPPPTKRRREQQEEEEKQEMQNDPPPKKKRRKQPVASARRNDMDPSDISENDNEEEEEEQEIEEEEDNHTNHDHDSNDDGEEQLQVPENPDPHGFFQHDSEDHSEDGNDGNSSSESWDSDN